MKQKNKKLILIPKKDYNKTINKKTNKTKIFNFFNLHDLYYYHKNQLFKKTITKENYNFIDGFVLSVWLTLTNFQKIKRNSGPDFILDFLNDKKLNKNKKHLFLGYENKDISKIIEKFPILSKQNIKCYNPPYVNGLEFSKKEIKKISSIIKKNKINYVWVGVGCPKQNILSFNLTKYCNPEYFFNIGAALDFGIGKKKRAPKLIRKLGIEWLYRLLTDFNHSKKKVYRHFIALKYLLNTSIKDR
jgi:N-acetylglucosaminyldiphosphoundecaprenol N-acetyl-beta-D-mannosaminyltransferase